MPETLHPIVFVALCFLTLHYVRGDKCDVENQECVTSAIRRIYPYIISGNASLGVDSSDPIIKDKIVANLPTMNYTVTNSHMHGMSNCEVMEARFRVVDQVWHLYLLCPLLILKMHYHFDGYVAAERFLGEGESQIKFETYHISLNGGLHKEKRVDGKEYIKLINFAITRLEVTGKVSFEFNNLFYDDQERSKKMNKFVNDHWQEFNSQAQLPGMYGLMGVLVDHFNQCLDRVAVDEVLSKV
ncbi:hypothetical protein K1T71_001373 [Dendrolimus kikuchii]|uniref:Uncharacterized protein n=1 Tax=Dendrolimus kikuchii TaxID=765133 RepID=A0ACC1DJ09_9NEOP|nr:hypothetical protein K1T71_001373 [Dendrolimus kikuchii]